MIKRKAALVIFVGLITMFVIQVYGFHKGVAIGEKPRDIEDVILYDVNGNPVAPELATGKVLLLFFDPELQRLIPFYNELWKKYSSMGLRIYAVVGAENARRVNSDYIEKYEIDFPVLVDRMNKYGVGNFCLYVMRIGVFPSLFLLEDGVVKYKMLWANINEFKVVKKVVESFVHGLGVPDEYIPCEEGQSAGDWKIGDHTVGSLLKSHDFLLICLTNRYIRTDNEKVLLAMVKRLKEKFTGRLEAIAVGVDIGEMFRAWNEYIDTYSKYLDSHGIKVKKMYVGSVPWRIRRSHANFIKKLNFSFIPMNDLSIYYRFGKPDLPVVILLNKERKILYMREYHCCDIEQVKEEITCIIEEE